MYASIFLRNNNLRSKSAILSTLRRCYAQKVFTQKPTLPHNLQNPSTVRSIGTLNKNLSTSRSEVLGRYQKILVKENSPNFVTVRTAKTSSLDVNTDVINNVFLYKYDRPKFFLFLNLFAPFQCLFWMFIAYYFYTKLPNRNYNKQSLTTYVKDHFPVVLITAFATFLGFTSTALIWLFSGRSVKYLILKKGGEAVTFLTYHPWKTNVGITIPLKNISCKTARRDMNNYMTLKAKGRPFFYILDSGGEFMNPKLFDNTVGFQRFKK